MNSILWCAYWRFGDDARTKHTLCCFHDVVLFFSCRFRKNFFNRRNGHTSRYKTFFKYRFLIILLQSHKWLLLLRLVSLTPPCPLKLVIIFTGFIPSFCYASSIHNSVFAFDIGVLKNFSVSSQIDIIVICYGRSVFCMCLWFHLNHHVEDPVKRKIINWTNSHALLWNGFRFDEMEWRKLIDGITCYSRNSAATFCCKGPRTAYIHQFTLGSKIKM